MELIITHRPRSFTELEHCHYITLHKIVLNKVIIAKFVREGRNGGICGKFIDQNNQFIGNQRMQQMRKINSSQDSPASMGLRHGDTIRIGYYIKSTVLGKGLVFDLLWYE